AFEPAMHEAPIRHDWDHAKVFRGNSPAIAGEPVSTAGAPNLAGFFIPLLMDVRVRALQRFSGQKPRRVLGTDHGGLSLQNAVERTIPQSREALGRENFQEMCLDFHSRNDAAIRQQLHLLGVGYDSKGWLNPMNRSGQETVSAVFEALNRSGLIERRDYFAYQNPTRGTILVNQDVVMEPPTSIRFTINFAVDGSKTVIETGAFLPELVLGAVAIAVNTRGKFASLVGKFAIHPVNERRLAVVGVDDLEVPAKFLVPAHSQQDAEMAAQLGISERLTVYDELGRINPRHGMEGDARDIRDLVIRRLGKAVHQEIGSWNVPRCARTESLVIEGVSQQLFVNLQPMKAHLRQAIESGEVAFNQAGWQRHALDFLERHDHWCISRQHWWGNDVPVAPNQDVLSTWFSMAAMALRGAGWPDSHHPAPVEEVFCSPVFLERWVIPAQLIALAITGRPVFNRIQVFGSLSLVERQLQETGIPDGGIPDEQRFVMRSIRKPMRTDTGNQIQPRALMDRFGADALRLGYLLCADNGDKRSLTLSESQLRKARRALKVLSTKIGGVLNIARRNDNGISINLFDEWIVSHCRQVRDRARELYQNCAYGEVAELLVDTIEHIKQYINVAARRKKSASGALRVTIGRVMAITEEAFSPICPFIFQHLKAETARIASATSGYQEQAWLSDLVAHLRSLKKEAVLSSPDPLLLDQLESALPEFARLSGIRLSVSHQPAAGKTAVFGRCLVVESGELEISGGGEAVLEWYRRILG
ncbi:MAG TPA: class I tRNA ligase family protein, partial [Calditrichia bacterium]|nr:class I tRNA ligase family protein [Calditrichia bacterium]